jgi:hypothetical protein
MEQLAQALAGRDLPVDVEVALAQGVCYSVTRSTLFFEGKTLSTEAKQYWFSHYEVTFKKAIEVHHRHLKDDIWDLCARSALLGVRAAYHAGTDKEVSEEAAMKATKDISCPTKVVFLHWCAA